MAGPVCVFDGLEVGSEGDGGTEEVRRTDLSLVPAAGLCGEVLWVTYIQLLRVGDHDWSWGSASRG